MGTPMKRPRTALTLEAKLDVIQRLEKGQTAASLGRLYNVNESSIRTIKKSADKIRSAIAQSCSLGAKKSLRLRSPLFEKMEMMLVTWMADQKEKNMPVNPTIVRAKALKLYKDLQQENGGPSAAEPFLASKGWFEKFKKRQNLHKVKLKDEAVSSVCIVTSNSPVNVKAESLLQIEQEEENEKKVVTPPDEVTTNRLAHFFTLADQLAQEAMDMDPNLERSLQFGRNLSSALAIYKNLYQGKQHTLKRSILTQYLKVPRSTTLSPVKKLSSSLISGKLLTPHITSSLSCDTHNSLQNSFCQSPVHTTGGMVSSPDDHSLPSPPCRN
jgi:hypothetical protein